MLVDNCAFVAFDVDWDWDFDQDLLFDDLGFGLEFWRFFVLPQQLDWNLKQLKDLTL